MTHAEKNALINELTAARDAAQAALDEALALPVVETPPPPSQRYRVSLGDAVDANGYTVAECLINGQAVPANASVAGQVHPDAQFAAGWFTLSSPVEQAPEPVLVGEQTFTWEPAE